jgi:hypothetical protein
MLIRNGKWIEVSEPSIKGGLPYAEKMEITPEMAYDILLNRNPHNRKVREDDVIKLARELEDGNWKLTSAMVSFDKKGQLLNGQHRLNACIKAFKPIFVWVMFGADKSALSVEDTGRSRTGIGDRKKFLNIPLEIPSVQTLDFFICRKGIFRQMSPAAKEKFYKRFKDPAEFVTEYMRNCKFKSTAIRAAMVAAYYNISHDILKRFIDAFSQGRPDKELEFDNADPAMYLREWLIGNPLNHSAYMIDRVRLYQLTTACIQNFALKVPMFPGKTRVQTPNVQEYPVPEIDQYLPIKEGFSVNRMMSEYAENTDTKSGAKLAAK